MAPARRWLWGATNEDEKLLLLLFSYIVNSRVITHQCRQGDVWFVGPIFLLLKKNKKNIFN